MATSFGLQEKNVYELYFHQNGKQGKKKKKKVKAKEVDTTGSQVCGQSSGLSEAEFLYESDILFIPQDKEKTSPLLNELGKKETHFHCLNSKHKERDVNESVT